MAAYTELHWTQTFTQKPVSSKDYFDNLAKRTAKKVHVLALAKAESMQYVLTHRMNLGKDWGQFPKWQPTEKEHPRESNNSFSGWRVERRDAGVYVLRNDVTNDNAGAWQGYSYVKNLANGTGWSAKALAGVGNRLRPMGSKVFSTQMPYGLAPWLRHKRNELKAEIKRQVGNKK